MLKSKDVDARLASMKKQLGLASKLFDDIEKGFKKVAEASNELSNQLEQIEQSGRFDAIEKKAFALELKRWEKDTESWADSIGGPQVALENLVKQYNAFLK